MTTTELLKKVRKIEIKTRGLSKHIFSGEYHSAFKGRGMSFSEVRDYQYGDDVRNIDWNVTARTGDPHVKIFEEERELTMMLLVDVSASSQFGTRGQLKRDLITELSAVLSFSASQNNDKVGLILFSDQIELYIPPKKGKSHILRIIRELLDHGRTTKVENESNSRLWMIAGILGSLGLSLLALLFGLGWLALVFLVVLNIGIGWIAYQHYLKKDETTSTGKGTDLGKALQYLNNIQKKKSIAFVLSDFMDKNYEDALKIVARRHDLIGIHLYDTQEQSINKVGLIKAKDAETGKMSWLDTSSRSGRENYAAHYQENFDHFKNAFLKSGADFMSIRTDQSYVKTLMQFFKKRG